MHLGGMRMAGGSVAVATMTVGGVSTVRVSAVPMSSVAVSTVAVASVTDLGDAADRHRGEASGTQREGEPIDVHTPNTTCREAAW